MGYSIY